jgi:hypothetical protein
VHSVLPSCPHGKEFNEYYAVNATIKFNVIETTVGITSFNTSVKKYVYEDEFPAIYSLNKDSLQIDGLIDGYNDVLNITGNNIEMITTGEYIWSRKINK